MFKKTMRSPVILLIIIFTLFQSAFSSELITLQSLLPEINGWKSTESPHSYNKENLYEYINGNCELYFSYGFKELISAYYRNFADSSQEITVDIYDLGTALNAFGVYSSMIHPDYNYDEIGNEAIISSQEIRFWQDRYEIEIHSNFSETAVESMKYFAHTISQKIPTEKALAEFQWLIKEDQLPHTFKYVARGFLGQDSLPGGFEALYNLNGTVVKGFVVNCKDIEQSRGCLGQFLLAQNRVKEVELQTIEDGFQSYHQYTGYLLVKQYDRWLYGAISEANIEVCQLLTEKIMENLSSITQ
jgi:hypothetical protein